jgi:hypothetical protein
MKRGRRKTEQFRKKMEVICNIKGTLKGKEAKKCKSTKTKLSRM